MNNKWFELVTSKVWIALIAWISLAAIAKLIMYLLADDLIGLAVSAGLELAGLLIFVNSLVKWYKQRKSLPRPINEKKFNNKSFVNGLLIALGAIALIGLVYSAGNKYMSSKEDKYLSCMNECSDAGLTNTQESVCKVDCIKKYK